MITTDRPIAYLDIESSGTDVAADRIVELAVLIDYPDHAAAPYRSVRRLNPQVPIPAEVTAVHGISDEDVRTAPAFRQIARALWDLLDPCDLVGFGLRTFDLPLLQAEFKRCGMALDHTTRRLIDLQSVFFREEPRTLAAAARIFAGLELGEAAHTAAGDTEVLPLVLKGQLAKYPHLPRDLDGLHRYCDEFRPYRTPVEDWFGDDAENPVFQKGKSVRGMTLAHVLDYDAGFIAWMMKQDGIEEEVKEFIRHFRRHLYGAPVTP